MHTLMPSRHLVIPLGDRDLTVTVDDHDAVLDLLPARPDGPDAVPAAADAPVSIRVPARALVAALRVAWADEHDRLGFEPWRDGTRDRRWNRYRYDDDISWYDDAGDADLGDGDPHGYLDPTVVPFPGVVHHPSPRRSGHAWEPWEHDVVREAWLAAEPDADKNELIRGLAERLERGIGGVSARLRLAGCDPTRPGSQWDGTYGSPPAGRGA